jgi:hypothetical protein
MLLFLLLLNVVFKKILIEGKKMYINLFLIIASEVFVSFIFRDDHLPTTSNKHLKFSERQAMMKAIENSITLDDKDDVGEAISGVRTTRYPTITHSLFEYIVAIDINDIN